MPGTLDKVTAFITRNAAGGQELLLFQHPYAGCQIPAGTVEAGETPEQAALREAAEETGLSGFTLLACLGVQESSLPAGRRVIMAETPVTARPDSHSFAWARLRRGLTVELTGRAANGYIQATWLEHDRFPDPQYISMQITGWLPESALGERLRRHFFHLAYAGESPARWEIYTDRHFFAPFWAPLDDLPQIVSPQDEWLAYLPRA